MAKVSIDTNTGLIYALTGKIGVLQKQVDDGKSGKQLQKAINDIVKIKNLLILNLEGEKEFLDTRLIGLRGRQRRQQNQEFISQGGNIVDAGILPSGL